MEEGKCGSGKDPLPTVVDHMKENGKRVGIVSTARVTHATPGAAYAKIESRKWEGTAPPGCKGRVRNRRKKIALITNMQ